MNEKINVKPDTIRLLNLLEEVENGYIQIPKFQRDFIWENKQMLDLFDSIAKGYPMGSLLFWSPKVKYPVNEIIGVYKIEKTQVGNKYVLDGSQRITTLFGVLTNPKKYDKRSTDKELQKFTIYYDLKKKEFVSLRSQKDKKYYFIPLFKIIDTYEFLDFLREIETQSFDKVENRELIDNAKAISKVFYDYEIPYVEIRGGDIKSAVEIFSRVNSTGTEISEDFMLSARSYNNETGFIFSEKISEFLSSLQKFNFENLKRDTILYCIANSKDKAYFDVKTEELLEPNLEELAIVTFEQIEKAIKFLYERLFVIDVQLLPYPTQLIFIANYFRLNPNPSEEQLKKLENWFWITSYANYFTIYSLSQQRASHNVFVDFARGKHEDGIFILNDKFSVAEFPEKIDFKGVRAKTLQLFLLRNILKNQPIELYESIKELYIFDKKDKSPANVLLRISSDYEHKKDANSFIKDNNINILEKYFINSETQKLFLNGEIDSFLKERKQLIMQKEAEFIKQFQYLRLE